MTLALIATGCLLTAEPPELYSASTDHDESSWSGFATEDACASLQSCCDVLDREAWERESCRTEAARDNEDDCADVLCFWASQDASCASWACDAGCALPEC